MVQGDPSWKRLPETLPADLSEANQQLHHAAQFLAAAGHSFLSHRSDDAHTNLAWEYDLGLKSRPFQLDQEYTLGLNYELFRLELKDRLGIALAMIGLDQKTKKTILEELNAEFAARSNQESGSFEPIQHYELPAHPIQQGAPFQKKSIESLRYLRLLRDNASTIITHVNQHLEDASEMRIWPHHFDNGSICVLENDGQGAMTKTVGWGFSIPNDTDTEHHFYINHWSQNETETPGNLPDLPEGAYWSDQGKLMAILPIRAFRAYGNSAEQAQLAQAFFEKGIKASRMIIQA